MDLLTIKHRPDSEDAFITPDGQLHLRLRAKHGDINQVTCIYGDPYDYEDTFVTNATDSTNEATWLYQAASLVPTLCSQIFDYWELTIQPVNNRLQYAFLVTDNFCDTLLWGERRQVSDTATNRNDPTNYFKFPYMQLTDAAVKPAWLAETVWYQIFPERFNNGNKNNDPSDVLAWNPQAHPTRTAFYGGDLQGIYDQLNYLANLGINGIYLCPIFKAPSNHKYDTADYFQLDPHFGDAATLSKLINKAHQLGMHILFDAVFNHIGFESTQWQDVLRNGQQSPYYDWFLINNPDFLAYATGAKQINVGEKLPYEMFSYEKNMPKLNTQLPAVQNYLYEIGRYWLAEFDIDGWRLDVSDEVDHRFWREFCQQCRDIKSDCYIVGESWKNAQSVLAGDQFNGVMNYPLTDIIKGHFIENKYSQQDLITLINEQYMLYRSQVNECMFNILDSHDTTRLLTACHENVALEKQILAFTYLQLGTPCLYYGDEIGMTGKNDPDCRKCMDWDTTNWDTDLQTFIKQLISLRKTYGLLIQQVNLRWLTSLALPEPLLEFQYSDGNHSLIGIFNTTSTAHLVPSMPGYTVQLQSGYDNTLLAPQGFVIASK
ncbi:alpha-glycosidase [Periweissella cryptocerci]|uniref:Alpha-glycosidase n=1 Tax=Periweissella cryptocerci TaxID=2506420 RepID=A0A4P6YRZ2_9LACO|nr:glycoside hydrolase family 13 protein [Periweissella cryptocerci]QBO35434.1 alpha-glycosidase [Periweissella cryptocerci]